MTECRIPELSSNDPRVIVGRFTYGSPSLHLWGVGERIVIGSFCSIAQDVAVFGGGEHNTQWVTTYPLRIALGDPSAGDDGHPASKGETRIGNDVWIGDGAAILSGVVIGDGAVIGARAVVTRDVPAYHVVAGNPARLIRARFTDAQIRTLLRIEWWNWPIERIREKIGLLSSPDIGAFIEACANG